MGIVAELSPAILGQKKKVIPSGALPGAADVHSLLPGGAAGRELPGVHAAVSVAST